MKYVGVAGPAYTIPRAERNMNTCKETGDEPGPADYHIPGNIEKRALEKIKHLGVSLQPSPKKIRPPSSHNMIP
jgi:hypothetical protein